MSIRRSCLQSPAGRGKEGGMLGLKEGGSRADLEAKGLASAQNLVSWERRSRYPPHFLLPPQAPDSASSCCALPTHLGTSHPGMETLVNLTLWGLCTADFGRCHDQEEGLSLLSVILNGAGLESHQLHQRWDGYDIGVVPLLRKSPFLTHRACNCTITHTSKQS